MPRPNGRDDKEKRSVHRADMRESGDLGTKDGRGTETEGGRDEGASTISGAAQACQDLTQTYRDALSSIL